MSFKSILKPNESVLTAVAAAGSVWAVYQLDIGPVANAHASDANHPALASARKKASWTAFALVSGLFLITKDANVAIFGYASVVAMEIHYRHAIMASPATGQIVAPGPSAYQPAQNVIPISLQGQTG